MPYETNAEVRARQQHEHREKFESLAQWLGVESLKQLVPFPPSRIRAALAAGDEHLNTLPLVSWDGQHGLTPDERQHRICHCCKQSLPVRFVTPGVWGLVRAAIRRDHEAGRTPLVKAWSLSDTVCVLKHVARYHVA
jgi:hypothetical protein